MGACVFVTCVPGHNYMKVFTSHSEHFQLLMKNYHLLHVLRTRAHSVGGGGGRSGWVIFGMNLAGERGKLGG